MKEWPIRRLILSLAGLLIAVLMMILLVLFRTSIMQTLLEREHDSIQQQLEQSVELLNQSMDEMRPLAAAWAERGDGVLNDMAQTMADATQARAMRRLYQVELRMVTDLEGAVVASGRITEDGRDFPIDAQLIQAVSQAALKFMQDPSNAGQDHFATSGYLPYQGHWYYFAMSTVLGAKGSGEPVGMLFLGREVSTRQVAQVILNDEDSSAVELLTQADAVLSPHLQQLLGGETVVTTDQAGQIQALVCLPSFVPGSILAVRLVQPRTLYQHGERFMVNALLLFGLIGFFVMILLFEMLERLLLIPLKRLSESVANANSNQAGDLTLPRYRGQELNVLVDALQEMLSRMAASQGIIEKSHSTMQVYQLAIRNTADDVLILNRDGQVEYANPAAQENMGYPQAEIAGRLIYDFMSEPEDLIDHIRREMADRRPWKGEIRFYRRDSFPEAEDVSMAPILNDQNGVERIIVIKRNVEEKKRYEDMLFQLAHFDTLTQLPNRFYITAQMEEAIEAAQTDGSLVAFMLMDINRFKSINDTMGHAWGDEALKMLALRLDMAFPDAMCVARTGGDEFALLFPRLKDESQVIPLAERVMELCDQPCLIQEREFLFGFSLGVSVYPADGNSADVLFQNADTAMYIAKAHHTSSWERFNESFFHKINERVDLEHDMRRALKNGEFRAYFQPQIDVQSGRIVGSEALIRWHSPHGVVMPHRFIPIAEEMGMIVPITWWMLEQACALNQRLIQQGYDLVVAVNIPAQVLNHTEFMARIRQTLEQTGMHPRHLNLELTEDALISDASASNQILGRLQRMGMEVSIDDFGTGYSSLNYLKRLNINWLKLDRSFVAGIPDIDEDTAIVRATIEIARSLNLRVLAEGVETQRQLECLKQFGCHQFQGFLVSRPLPEREFMELIHQQLQPGDV